MSKRNVLVSAHIYRVEQAVEFFPAPGSIAARRVNTLSFGGCPSTALFLSTESKTRQTGTSASSARTNFGHYRRQPRAAVLTRSPRGR
jgi:hypothetical protein